MSAPGNGQPQIPQLPPVASLKCGNCQHDFIVRVPPPRIINAPDFTTIVFVHERFDKCPQCGTTYMFNVAHINPAGQLGMTWIAIQTEQSAIVPGTEKNLTQAVQTEEIAKKIKLN
jgi:hypothetical protein